MTDTPPEFAEEVPTCAPGQTISEEDALKRGMEARSKEFMEKGAEVCAAA